MISGNLVGTRYFAAGIDPANVGAVGRGETNIAKVGVVGGQTGIARKTSAALEAGLVASCYTTTDNIVLVLDNASAGAIDPAAGDWEFILFAETGESITV